MKKNKKKQIIKRIKRVGLIFSKLIKLLVLIALDITYLFYVYNVTKSFNLMAFISFSPMLFRVVFILNILVIGYYISKIINYGTNIISIRPISIKKDPETNKYAVLFTTQTEKNIKMYSDLKKYYIYVTNNKNKFIKNKFYFIDLSKFKELRSIELDGMSKGIDLRRFEEKDFK